MNSIMRRGLLLILLALAFCLGGCGRGDAFVFVPKATPVLSPSGQFELRWDDQNGPWTNFHIGSRAPDTTGVRDFYPLEGFPQSDRLVLAWDRDNQVWVLHQNTVYRWSILSKKWKREELSSKSGEGASFVTWAEGALQNQPAAPAR